jgi:hypothetical protein
MQNQQSKHYISKKVQLRDCRGMIPSWDPMVQKPEKIMEHGNMKSYNLILFRRSTAVSGYAKDKKVH